MFNHSKNDCPSSKHHTLTLVILHTSLKKKVLSWLWLIVDDTLLYYKKVICWKNTPIYNNKAAAPAIKAPAAGKALAAPFSDSVETVAFGLAEVDGTTVGVSVEEAAVNGQ